VRRRQQARQPQRDQERAEYPTGAHVEPRRPADGERETERREQRTEHQRERVEIVPFHQRTSLIR
jgi:hypothetical protein